MLVTTLEHGRKVFARLAKNPWLVIDTETENKPPWRGRKDGLAFDRQHITMWSVCYKGESYSFPTSHFHPKYPSPRQWWKLLKPIWKSKKRAKVFWNANYDVLVFGTSIQFARCPLMYDAMIGAWMADPGSEKRLKARAARYGRFLQETKNVDFTDRDALADYAEQDVVATDEAYQMQRFGFVDRPRIIPYLNADGKLVGVDNPMPTKKLVVKKENLRPWDKVWLDLIEFPVLRSTMRAERRGFPLDVQFVADVEQRMKRDQAKLLKYIYKRAGRVVNLDSNADLKFVFDKLGIHNPFKTPSGKTAFGKFILARLVNSHPIIAKMQQQKQIRTLLSFYVGTPTKSGGATQGLPYFVNPRDGCIHPVIGTVGAKTGRSSCGLPNLQQIPSRADIYEIKKAFVAPGVVEYRIWLKQRKKLVKLRKAAKAVAARTARINRAEANVDALYKELKAATKGKKKFRLKTV